MKIEGIMMHYDAFKELYNLCGIIYIVQFNLVIDHQQLPYIVVCNLYTYTNLRGD